MKNQDQEPESDPDPNPDPLVKSMDPRIRIHTKMSRIRNIGFLSMGWKTLQMKGRWIYNINVWFPFMYSQKWICYFQNRIIMICLPVPTLIYLGKIYIFPRSVCLFCCREICGPILGNWYWKRAFPRKGIYKWDFPCSECKKMWEYLNAWKIVCSGLSFLLLVNCVSLASALQHQGQSGPLIQ